MEGAADQGVLTAPAATPRSGASLVAELAGADDDERLRALLHQNPIAGDITVAFEREPSFAEAAAVEGDRHDAVVVRDADTGRMAAMGTRSVRNVFFNGRQARVGYLGQLRVDAAYRGRRDVFSRGFSRIGALRHPDELPFDLTSIMADNRAARRILGAGLPGLPRYRPGARLTTLILPVGGRPRRRRRPALHADIEIASRPRLAEIADCLQRNLRRYQFAPCWSADELDCPRRCRDLEPSDFRVAVDRGRITGCLAVWDQRGFKQAVVTRYAPKLRRWRPVVNAMAPLIGTARLPAVGRGLACAFASHVAVDDDDPEILCRLLEHARHEARRRDLACLLVGFASRNPLLDAVRRTFPHRAYESVLYLVTWPGSDRAITLPDGRPAQVEVAIL
jgi:hypothetical protein